MEDTLSEAIARTSDCGRSYAEAATGTRRQWNQSFFEWFEITGSRVTTAQARGPYGLLLESNLVERLEADLELIRETENPEALYERRGSNMLVLVGGTGFEPVTSSVSEMLDATL